MSNNKRTKNERTDVRNDILYNRDLGQGLLPVFSVFALGKALISTLPKMLKLMAVDANL